MGTRFLFRLIQKTLHVHAMCGVTLQLGTGASRPRIDGSRQALGQSEGGRYLRVVYVPDEDGEGVFMVTAYRLTGRELKAYRRRKRRRGR